MSLSAKAAFAGILIAVGAAAQAPADPPAATEILFVRYAKDGRSARLCRIDAEGAEKDLADATCFFQVMRPTPRGSILAVVRKPNSLPTVVELDRDGRVVREWSAAGVMHSMDMDLFGVEMTEGGNVVVLGTDVSRADQHDRKLFIAELDGKWGEEKTVRKITGFPEDERILAVRMAGPDRLLIVSKTKGFLEIDWTGQEKAALKVPVPGNALLRDFVRRPDGNVVAAFSDGRVAESTPAGEVVWSARVREAKSLQLLPDGRVLVATAGGFVKTHAVELDPQGKVVREYENAQGPIVRLR